MNRIRYRQLVSLARLAVRTGRSKYLEIVVLRHQLAVLHRSVNSPKLDDHDRSLLGAIAASLPHYNTHRPHRSLDQQPPLEPEPRRTGSRDRHTIRSTRCQGLINEYETAA